jgi:N-acetylmuramoyl-L-alanine amidase
MKRRIVLSAGHSNTPGQDQGAIANGYVEGQLTVEFRDLVKKHLNKFGVTVNVDPNNYVTGSMVRLFKQWFGVNDIIIDFHFNAASNIAANGTEAIVPKKYTAFEFNLAVKLVNAINKSGIGIRRVFTEDKTPRKKLFFFTLKSETVLLEVCFITNKKDMQIYQTTKDEMAYHVAEVLHLAL